MLQEVGKYCKYLKRRFAMIGFLKIWVRIFIQYIYSWYLPRIFTWDRSRRYLPCGKTIHEQKNKRK